MAEYQSLIPDRGGLGLWELAAGIGDLQLPPIAGPLLKDR